MIIIVDNHSFLTQALVELVAGTGCDCLKVQAGDSTLREIENARLAGIVLGPGLPESEILAANRGIVTRFAGQLPMLGIDLGMQAIVTALGGASVPSGGPAAGSRVSVVHDTRGVFEGLASPMEVGCFCASLVDEASLPERLQISAHTMDGEIMGVRGRAGALLEGVQFCPQSLLTVKGGDLIENFVEMVRESADHRRSESPAMENRR